MFIQTIETPNPQTLKFVTGTVVLSNGSAEFLNLNDAIGKSPLAVRLFAIDGIDSVFFGTDFVAITKQDNVEWTDIRTYILGILFEFFSNLSEPVIIPDNKNQVKNELSKAEQMIIELIETRVRPAVAGDGGDIVFVKFEKGIVWLKMHGACAGCPSANITLKMGIENMLRNYVPEVLEVRAV